jgi:hypothetical protein
MVKQGDSIGIASPSGSVPRFGDSMSGALAVRLCACSACFACRRVSSASEMGCADAWLAMKASSTTESLDPADNLDISQSQRVQI